MSGLLLEQLGVAPYRQRFPWLGGDLQTLRDTLRPMALPPDQGQPLQIAVPALASGAAAAGQLLAFLDRPSPLANSQPPKGLVLLLHGLGGSSRREGLRRLGLALVRRLQTACPACGSPGWGLLDTLPGLPCGDCGTTTTLTLSEIWGCPQCGARRDQPRRDGRLHADPGQCPWCNP